LTSVAWRVPTSARLPGLDAQKAVAAISVRVAVGFGALAHRRLAVAVHSQSAIGILDAAVFTSQARWDRRWNPFAIPVVLVDAVRVLCAFQLYAETGKCRNIGLSELCG
jgi:hypothetical protein